MNHTTTAAMMMIAASTLASAQGLVQKADSPITGQYIVTIDEETLLPAFPALAKDEIAAKATETIARERRFEIRQRFSAAMRGFVARMSADEAAALATEPWVKLVEEDGRVELTGTQDAPPSWGLDRIDQRQVPLDGSYVYNNAGAGVDVYVVDSGIRSTHVDFGGRVDTVNAFTAVNDGRGTEDCFGHGTMVAGIIGSATYGVAKGVTLHPVRIVDCNGMATISGLVSAIDWITAQHAAASEPVTTSTKRGKKSSDAPTATVRPAVVNISLISGGSPTIDTAVQNSIATGITYVVAAGNSGVDSCFYSPARVAGAITVGASNDADNVWIYSNGGSCVDLFAPGVLVNTTLSRTDTDITATTGTSASAPHVAGVAALYLATSPSSTPVQVSDALRSVATAGALAAVPAYSPNLLLFSAAIGADMPPSPGFSASCSNRRCTFVATSSTDDYGIVSYHWDFGDGDTASGPKAIHRFPSPGSYFEVTLTVTDTAGQNASVTQAFRF